MIRIACLIGLAALSLAGCASLPETSSQPVYPSATVSQNELMRLPAPSAPVAIAVYGFTDQTGQFKPTETGQTLSRAVSQGASSILVKSLQDAGSRSWFTVVEREQLKNLLQERQIIREMRDRYLGEKDINPEALPPMLFAGVLLEGGIIGYDTNTLTGGAGAGFLGINASTQYRQDTVTVYLRAVSVRTGEVLTTVTASKTIASRQLGVNAFRYVGFKQLLEVDTGITTNEPDQLALQQAVEKAVYGLVIEGVELKLWNFADPAAGQALMSRYHNERDGLYPAQQFADQRKKDPGATSKPVREAKADKARPAAAEAPKPTPAIEPAKSAQQASAPEDVLRLASL